MSTTITDADRVIIETRVASEGPSPIVAYFLWFFLGVFGVHRFYLGRPVSAIVQLLLCLIVIGLVWWVADLFLIPGMIREKRMALRGELVEGATHAAAPEPRQPAPERSQRRWSRFHPRGA